MTPGAAGRSAVGSPVLRRALTLVELVVSIAVTSILLTGLASAIVLASRALPGQERLSELVIRQSEIADQIVTEVQAAHYIIEHTTNAITFTVADRDGDGCPERIRYAWSGTADEPLTREYNSGSAVTVLEDVQQFDLAYDLRSVTEEYPGPPVEGTEEVLSSHGTVTGSAASFPVSATWWPGQYFEPSLPNDALSWRVTRVKVSVKRKGAADGQTLVQLRTPDGNKKPTDTVLEEHVMGEADLGDSYGWHEIAFSGVAGLSPAAGLCLVLKHGGGGTSARLRCDDGGDRTRSTPRTAAARGPTSPILRGCTTSTAR